MSTEIVLVGGLLDEPDPAKLVDRLKAEVSAAVEWQWVYCTAAEHFQPHWGPTNRMLEKLNSWQSAQRKGKRDLKPEKLFVVKLCDLHGRTQSLLYRAWPDPILAPDTARTADRLIQWLRSPAANLFPPREWWAGIVEAALVAILCKLLKNKSWNSTLAGHAWTKEDDLLNQSPVQRHDYPAVGIEARRVLDSLNGRLLLTKGASQGNTPKEWSIDTRFLPLVKQAILSNSVSPLCGIAGLEGLFRRIEQCGERTVRLDQDVVNERIRAICRARE